MSEASPVQRITCENPSPMTLQGTNTYVIGGTRTAEDGSDAAEVVIIDPGPADHPEHLERVRAVVGARRVSQILVTHRHRDHTGAAASFGEVFAAPVRGHSPEQCRGVDGESVAALTDGEVIELPGLRLSVLHTPGHTSDSVCFWLRGAGSPGEARSGNVEAAAGSAAAGGATDGIRPTMEAMLTGDTILGEGSTMLDHPDGTLTDYLHSLERLRGHARAQLLPAHGPAHASVAEVAQRYLDHRLQRLDQVRVLLRTAEQDGSRLSAAALGELIYGERSGLPAGITTKIAAAQMQHLQELGER